MTREKRNKPESIAELLKLSSKERLEYLNSWLDCANSDIQVIELVYPAGNYPAVAYHLEQSVEKIAKCFAYLIHLTDSENDLKTEIKHQTFNIFKFALQTYAGNPNNDKFEKSLISNLIFEKICNMLICLYLNHESTRSDEMIASDIIYESKSLFELMKHGEDKLNQIRRKKLSNLDVVSHISCMTCSIEIYRKIMCEINILADDLNIKQKIIDETVASILEEVEKNGYNKIDTKKKIDSNLQNIMNELRPDRLKLATQRIMLLICIWDLILRLGLITDSVEANSRYPSLKTHTTPFTIYTANHPIIKNMSDLIEITKQLLSAVTGYLRLEYPEHTDKFCQK